MGGLTRHYDDLLSMRGLCWLSESHPSLQNRAGFSTNGSNEWYKASTQQEPSDTLYEDLLLPYTCPRSYGGQVCSSRHWDTPVLLAY